jgi:hypothetical protein
MQDHITRWMPEMWWRDMNSWRNEITKMKNWCNRRNAEVYKHLQDYFKLGAITGLAFEVPSDFEMPSVFINKVQINNRGLSASYFQNEKLELRYEDNSQSYGWEIMIVVGGSIKTETILQQNLSYQVPDGCNFIRIKLVKNLTSLKSLASQGIIISTIDNQIQISDLQLPSVISIYDITGRLITTVAVTESSTTIPVRRKGAYIVKVGNDIQSHTQKVIL